MPEVNGMGKAYFRTNEGILIDGASQRGYRGSKQAKREVMKQYDIIAKAILLFEGFLSLLRTDHKYLVTPQHIVKA
jgi:hypothetical protein